MDAKKVLESVRPSNCFGCSGSSRFFLCWRGDSQLSIYTADEHSFVVFSSVFVAIISGGHASLSSQGAGVLTYFINPDCPFFVVVYSPPSNQIFSDIVRIDLIKDISWDLWDLSFRYVVLSLGTVALVGIDISPFSQKSLGTSIFLCFIVC